MKKKSLSIIAGLLLIAFSSSAQAHSVWINSFESHAHKPPHTMVSLGWGHGLEIIPRTDLSNLHVGDLVEVDVLFYGQPLSASARSIEYITAHSSSFGQSDNFSLFSYLKEGKGQFRVQSSGQWMISVSHKGDVTKDGELKDLYGKTDLVYHGATLTFNVK